MSTNVFSLPVPLILLIHLHILQYPHANKPEYDHNVFNSRVRGVRDRMKTMEDVCYFFVMRLEGKDNARKVIQTYPCSQPSDTTAFRTSLAKYLENLRHASVFPSSGKRAKTVVNAPSSEESANNGAWWWKDVVVRKSLLEECAGEKFERLLLALSTHVLMKGSKSKVAPDETQNVLRSQPSAYTHRLAEFQMSHNTWARTAASLLQRQRDLKLLRANILQHGSCGLTKHARLSTEKLLALMYSKFQELLTDQWAGPGGRSALNFIIELAALRTDSPEGVSSMDPKEKSTIADMHQVPMTPPTPLPIAAAHHPGTLRKLSKRILPKQSTEQQSTAPSTSGTSSSWHAVVALSRRIDAEERMLQALKDASARARKAASGLRTRLDRAIAQDASSRRRASALRPMNMNLWQHAHRVHINFKPQLGDADFTAAGLPVPGHGSQVPIQTRVDDIRSSLRPAYPAIPSMSIAAHGHGYLPGASRLPRRVEVSAPRTPEGAPHGLEGVTAPETVRPRSQPQRAREGEISGARKPPLRRPSPLDDTGLDKTPRPKRSYDAEDTDEEASQFQDEGPSMSVRDLLLQADTTCFDIISDGEDFGEQSFGWA